MDKELRDLVYCVLSRNPTLGFKSEAEQLAVEGRDWDSIIRHMLYPIEKRIAALECTGPIPNKHKHLKKRIDRRDLSNRVINCLNHAGIHTYFDLVKYDRFDILSYVKYAGKLTVEEIERHLQKIGLRLGMLDEDGDIIEQTNPVVERRPG